MEEDIVIKPVDTGYRLVITAELTPDEEKAGTASIVPNWISTPKGMMWRTLSPICRRQPRGILRWWG